MDGIQVFMQELAEKAGALAMEFFNGIRPNEVYSKATAKDLVSTADGQVEALLTRMIRERFPDHGVFGEESGKNNDDAEYRWVIDPIDGTQSFVKQHVYFSISIALQRNKETIAGAVYAPALKQFFFAELGKGASLNGNPIHAAGCSALEESACVTGFGYLRGNTAYDGLPMFCEIVPQLRDIKRCGSAALDLCNVAKGTFDAFWEYSLQLYDIAAGVLIAREAGAEICDFSGGDKFPENGILVANPVLLQEFVKITSKY